MLPCARGDATTTYNWQRDVANAASDWYFRNGSQSLSVPVWRSVSWNKSKDEPSGSAKVLPAL
jgi:hypothetical protein